MAGVHGKKLARRTVNPSDATLRNVRASHKRVAVVEARLSALLRVVETHEARLTRLEGSGRGR